ncbi:MAG: resolvase [Methanobrevibacter sp.]|nr:resolvase [Methanobrevibacter sp.]
MNFNKNDDDSHNIVNFENYLEDDLEEDYEYDLDDEEEEDFTEEVHISTSLSSKKIMELIDEYPNLKTVTCPKSIYNRISKKYLEALEKLGIAVEIRYNWGNFVKYTEKERVNVINLIKDGLSPQEIAKKLNTSVQIVYYLKNKNKDDQIKLKRGKKKKYSYDMRKKVKKLANDGVPIKEISKNENIPLRTVYDIIKEK